MRHTLAGVYMVNILTNIFTTQMSFLSHLRTCGVAVRLFRLESIDDPHELRLRVRARSNALKDNCLADEERQGRLGIVHRDVGDLGIIQLDRFLVGDVA